MPQVKEMLKPASKESGINKYINTYLLTKFQVSNISYTVSMAFIRQI